MRAIKIKHMVCLCPARLKTNKRDRGVLSATLQGPWSPSAGLLEGVVEQFRMACMWLSDSGQRLPSSYPGLEFIPENMVHTMPSSFLWVT